LASTNIRQNGLFRKCARLARFANIRQEEIAAAELGKALTMITQRFKSSGLKVSEGKTEIAIFYKNNCHPAEVLIIDTTVRTKDTIKVLGIKMDTMLSWHEQVNNTVNNVQSRINAIRKIQELFLADELVQLLKTYCYPSLYYSFNVWLTPSLNAKLPLCSSNYLNDP
jgi:hypothetical protein